MLDPCQPRDRALIWNQAAWLQTLPGHFNMGSFSPLRPASPSIVRIATLFGFPGLLLEGSTSFLCTQLHQLALLIFLDSSFSWDSELYLRGPDWHMGTPILNWSRKAKSWVISQLHHLPAIGPWTHREAFVSLSIKWGPQNGTCNIMRKFKYGTWHIARALKNVSYFVVAKSYGVLQKSE